MLVAAVIQTENGGYSGVLQTPNGERVFALSPYAESIPLSRKSVTTEFGYQSGVTLANLHLTANSLEM